MSTEPKADGEAGGWWERELEGPDTEEIPLEPVQELADEWLRRQQGEAEA